MSSVMSDDRCEICYYYENTDIDGNFFDPVYKYGFCDFIASMQFNQNVIDGGIHVSTDFCCKQFEMKQDYIMDYKTHTRRTICQTP